MPIIDDSSVGFTDELKRTPSVEIAVKKYSHADTRDIVSAVVRSTPVRAGGETWHKGGSNPNSPMHVTVELKDSQGRHVTTVHLDRNGNRV